MFQSTQKHIADLWEAQQCSLRAYSDTTGVAESLELRPKPMKPSCFVKNQPVVWMFGCQVSISGSANAHFWVFVTPWPFRQRQVQDHCPWQPKRHKWTGCDGPRGPVHHDFPINMGMKWD